jgi:N-acetylneuraminic acid mutarotase
MVYDGRNDAFVLMPSNGLGNETWVYSMSDSIWTRKYPETSPPGRGLYAIAYDERAGKVVLFGGQNKTCDLNDTWAYDTAANHWSRLEPGIAGCPPASGNRMAYDRSVGLPVLFTLNNTQEKDIFSIQAWTCNLTGGLWEPRPAANSPTVYRSWEHAFGITYDPVDDIFIALACDGCNFLTWTYDLESNNWTYMDVSAEPSWKRGYSFTFDESRGVAILHGGDDELPGENLTWAYNYTSNTWTAIGTDDAPCWAYQQSAYDTRRHRTVLFDSETVWTYDLASRRWEILSRCPSGRSGPAMVYDSVAGAPLMYGGNIGYGGSSDLWQYDSALDHWTYKETTGRPPIRNGHAMTYDEANGEMLVYGGWADTCGQSPERYNNTWAYNSTSNTWTERNQPVNPGVRLGIGMVYDSKRGTHTVFGGSYYSPRPKFDSVWSYNLSENLWTEFKSDYNPGERAGHSMGYDPQNDRVVIFGGSRLDTWDISKETWIYDTANNTWTNATQAHGPTPRQAAGFIYNPPTGSFRLFGGKEKYGSGGLLNDCWDYNLTTNTWTNITPPDGPSPRSDLAMAYDPARDETVIFGGYIGDIRSYPGDYRSETWVLGKTNYRPPGEFTSRPFDTGGSPVYGRLRWNAVVPSGTCLRFQLRTADSIESLKTAVFVGPEGTAGTFYTASESPVAEFHDGGRWLQYRAFFDTTDLNFTPVLDSVVITYNLRQSIAITFPVEYDLHPETFNITWRASDPDNDTLSFDIFLENVTGSLLLASGLPDGTGSWTWNTSAVQNGTYRIRIAAVDDNPSIPLTVNATSGDFRIYHPPPLPPPNHLPHVDLLSPPNNSEINSTGVLLEWNGSDPDGDPLLYLVLFSDHPIDDGNASGSLTGNLSLQVNGLADNTTYYWTAIPTDARSSLPPEPVPVWTFTVRLEPVILPPINHPPVITSLPPFKVTAGNLYQYNITAIDEDFNILQYSLVNEPHNMSIDSTSGRLRWQTTLSDAGNHSVTVLVTDTAGATDNQAFTVSVLEPIIPPPEKPRCAITSPANISKVSGLAIVRGTAANGTLPITIVQVRLDDGQWQTATGLAGWSFTLDLSKTQNGRHTIEARSFDGSLYSDTASIQVDVRNPGPSATTGEPPWFLLILIIAIAAGIGIYLVAGSRRKA